MYERYGKDVEFLLVYIREAHSTDGWQVPRNEAENVLIESAKSEEMKHEHATSCARTLGIKFPALVDGMDNRVESEYSGWPDRLYLVNRSGKIAYKSGVGPAGFKPAELEAAIRTELGSTQ
jgi:iodothyronine deiodinase-like protein